MNTERMISWGALAAGAFFSLMPAPTLSAVELDQLAGDWTLADLTTPTRLREVYYNTQTDTTRTSEDSLDYARENEVLIEAFYPDPVAAGIRSFSMSATGAVSGDESGQIVAISGNRLVYRGSDEVTTLHSNTNGEILLVSGRDADQQEQILCLKRPDDLTQADLDGEWSLVSLIMPDDLVTTSAEGRLVDVYYRSAPRLTTGTITMDGSGNFSGIFAGTISGTPDGDISVTAGPNVVPFKTNSSKNLATGTVSDEDEREVIVLVRKPDTLAVSELAGTWRVSVIRIPSELTESFYNDQTGESRQAPSDATANPGERLADLFHQQPFELERLQVQVAADGSVAGTYPGTFTVGADRSATLTLADNSVTFYPNADKTFMVAGTADDEAHELIYCLKTSDEVPANAEEAADFQTIPVEGKLVLSWNGTSGLQLEESESLNGWGEVEDTSGSDTYVADPSAGGKRFFRLTTRPPSNP